MERWGARGGEGGRGGAGGGGGHKMSAPSASGLR